MGQKRIKDYVGSLIRLFSTARSDHPVEQELHIHAMDMTTRKGRLSSTTSMHDALEFLAYAVQAMHVEIAASTDYQAELRKLITCECQHVKQYVHGHAAEIHKKESGYTLHHRKREVKDTAAHARLCDIADVIMEHDNDPPDLEHMNTEQVVSYVRVGIKYMLLDFEATYRETRAIERLADPKPN